MKKIICKSTFTLYSHDQEFPLQVLEISKKEKIHTTQCGKRRNSTFNHITAACSQYGKKGTQFFFRQINLD